ncbi:hypothetical protein OCK74_25030 [Chitinophagaceae bacterium LB-8]|uniref:Lipoprotein n=1 Tax=Paraflavisolibacter caeni TaxID=2982496 RepID=A0A9X2Y2C7_9BACT|nr:hypothetical protein [Paraflavisolibacter caeni]MCU7552408.1 hypothetical protein [Paraflavisolibacter caeni]
MKPIASAAIMAVISVSALFSSCKKDDNAPPPVSSASLSPGKAGASFKTNTDFGKSNSFNVRNTATTFATSQTSSGLRDIKLQIGEDDGTRVIYFDLAVRSTASTASGNISINLSSISGLPLGHVRLEKNAYISVFSEWGQSTSGTITITRLTASEIEGTFSTTAGKWTINNGSFAGKF